MDNEMIEIVAKALWDDDQKFKSAFGFSNAILFGAEFRKKAVPWDYLFGKDIVSSVSQEWRDRAIMVIKAMREPTNKMMVAMENSEPQLECFLEKEKSPSYLVWIAAIDAIIEE